MNKRHNSVESFWNDYLNVNPYHKKETPQSFYFCDTKKDADECAELVVKGIKRQLHHLCGGSKKIMFRFLELVKNILLLIGLEIQEQ